MTMVMMNNRQLSDRMSHLNYSNFIAQMLFCDSCWLYVVHNAVCVVQLWTDNCSIDEAFGFDIDLLCWRCCLHWQVCRRRLWQCFRVQVNARTTTTTKMTPNTPPRAMNRTRRLPADSVTSRSVLDDSMTSSTAGAASRAVSVLTRGGDTDAASNAAINNTATLLLTVLCSISISQIKV